MLYDLHGYLVYTELQSADALLKHDLTQNMPYEAGGVVYVQLPQHKIQNQMSCR